MTTTRNSDDADEATALDEYIKAAIEHGQGIEAGDPDVSNAAYERHAHLLARFFPEEQRRQLVSLLNHESPSVRLWAALDTFQLDPKRSVEVLEAVAREPGLVGFSAEITLRELRAGRLAPP